MRYSRRSEPMDPATRQAISMRPKLEFRLSCNACGKWFSLFAPKYNCRNCGKALCQKHFTKKVVLYHLGYDSPQDTCTSCYEALVMAASRSAGAATGVWKQSGRCALCQGVFSPFRWRHHCRNCGECVCDVHSRSNMVLYHKGAGRPTRTCDRCRDTIITAGRSILSNSYSRVPVAPGVRTPASDHGTPPPWTSGGGGGGGYTGPPGLAHVPSAPDAPAYAVAMPPEAIPVAEEVSAPCPVVPIVQARKG